MKCPKCGAAASKDDKICRNCGTVLKKEKKSFLSLFKRKKNDQSASNVPRLTTSAGGDVDSGKGRAIKLGLIGICVGVIIILILVLIFHVASGKGLKQAQRFAEHLGEKITNVEKELDAHLKDNSSYNIVNKSDSFDYIYESEDSVSIDDVTFPEWAIGIIKTDSEKIEQVIFTDYRVLKKDSRGEKQDRRLDLSRYDRKTKLSTVTDDLDMDPFRIVYDLNYTKYEYRYYYKLDNGDVQAVCLTVAADLNNKFIFATSEDIFPFFVTDSAPNARADQLLQN